VIHVDVKEEMAQLKSKKAPSTVDIQKYVRYLTNVLKYDEESIYEDVPHWNKDAVGKAIKEVERENQKPKPKRYFVSLKEPLDSDLR
jgi:transcription initiation factor IIE alpha subunit